MSNKTPVTLNLADELVSEIVLASIASGKTFDEQVVTYLLFAIEAKKYAKAQIDIDTTVRAMLDFVPQNNSVFTVCDLYCAVSESSWTHVPTNIRKCIGRLFKRLQSSPDCHVWQFVGHSSNRHALYQYVG